MNDESELKLHNPLTAAEGAAAISRGLELAFCIALLALPLIVGVLS